MESTGTKLEVKSAWERIGDEYPAAGRFRLRRDQTRSLSSSAASSTGTAWYAFVLFSEDDGTARVRRAKPSTVTRWINARGGWNRAGHDDFDHQHKLPTTIVFPAAER